MIGGNKYSTSKEEFEYSYDTEYEEDQIPRPYVPQTRTYSVKSRTENPVIYFEITSSGGRKLYDGSITSPKSLGRLYFELRADLVPVACNNFLALVRGHLGYGRDGDLLDEKGNCSRSIYNNGGYFRDENFILRHTGPGCISYCNRGPDTNGSLFQVSFTENTDLDDNHVVFGCLATDESYDCLGKINGFGTAHGEPLEELRITDCNVVFPDPDSFNKD
eukprot:gene16950-22442_t